MNLEKNLDDYLKAYNRTNTTLSGVDIVLKSIDNKIATIAFLGGCSNCPSVLNIFYDDLKYKIIEKFRDEILDVRLYKDIDDELWNCAKSILRR